MKRTRFLALAGCLLMTTGTKAQKPPLLPEKDVAALANELSGETAKRNLEGIARFHRQRGSQGFHAAAELVAERLRVYGLSDVAILQFPADGKIFYGTQRSRPAWDAEFAELRQVRHEIEGEGGVSADGKTHWAADSIVEREKLLASYEAEPIVLAEDSESADVTADLVDVGEGTKESDYAGKDVKGKIILVSAQPGAVQDLAVGKFRAAGIVSSAQNQKTAWWGEDENLIRWGHLETFSSNKTFAFMVSLKTARGMRERLARGEKIMLQATVKAGQHPGNYEVVTATIPGADPKLKDEEIAFSCHLDHQRPGANDNASGCVTILEVARTLQKLISEGKLTRPARTMRFIFPPEIEGTMALLNSAWHSSSSTLEIHRNYDGTVTLPQKSGGNLTQTGAALAQRIKAVVHMDMVGGGPQTKAVFHVTRGPMSLPSFVHDVAWAFAEWVNEESYQFAATGKADYPLVAPEGGKEPLRAEYSAYTMGSDHDVYQDSSFGIPAIYLNDWPDRYIHTNFDTAANIDPTKLKRAAFIGAASGYFLAAASAKDDLYRFALYQSEGRSRRGELDNVRRVYFPLEEQDEVTWNLSLHERAIAKSTQSWFGEQLDLEIGKHEAKRPAAVGSLKYRRLPIVKGPLAVFGYDYFADHAKTAGVATPKLMSYEGLWGSGEEYAYEVLNFADGKRNAQEIRDAVSAEYGPVPLELVVEYFKALEKIGLVEEVK
ncbi:MAG TPA: M28 family peptidase [Candidatus Acidoferrum sp.]|nr:M28 family peptidase [Candidatus Acidoferrum sp.]